MNKKTRVKVYIGKRTFKALVQTAVLESSRYHSNNCKATTKQM